MTASVILDSYLRPAQVQGFDQGNRLVGAGPGCCACRHVYVQEFHSPSNPRDTLWEFDEGSFALVVLPMGLSTCEAEMIVGDQFDDLRLTQLTGAARSGEREMVVLKSHGCTYGAGPRRTKSLEVRRQRRLRFRSGDFLSDYIDPYI